MTNVKALLARWGCVGDSINIVSAIIGVEVHLLNGIAILLIESWLQMQLDKAWSKGMLAPWITPFRLSDCKAIRVPCFPAVRTDTRRCWRWKPCTRTDLASPRCLLEEPE